MGHALLNDDRDQLPSLASFGRYFSRRTCVGLGRRTRPRASDDASILASGYTARTFLSTDLKKYRKCFGSA